MRLRQKCAVRKNRKCSISAETQPYDAAACVKRSLCESSHAERERDKWNAIVYGKYLCREDHLNERNVVHKSQIYRGDTFYATASNLFTISSIAGGRSWTSWPSPPTRSGRDIKLIYFRFCSVLLFEAIRLRRASNPV